MKDELFTLALLAALAAPVALVEWTVLSLIREWFVP